MIFTSSESELMNAVQLHKQFRFVIQLFWKWVDEFWYNWTIPLCFSTLLKVSWWMLVQLNNSALLFNSSESELMKVVQLNISALLFNSSESELMNVCITKQFHFVIQLFWKWVDECCTTEYFCFVIQLFWEWVDECFYN